MPELPDVEVFRRRVARNALDRPIERVTVSDELVVRGIGPQTLRRRLRGATLTATRRHGKNLFVATDAGVHLLLHLGMTAQAACRRPHPGRDRPAAPAAGPGADPRDRGGVQPERMPRGWLLHDRRDGAECPRGRGVVRRYRAGGRGGYWCPTCQDA